MRVFCHRRPLCHCRRPLYHRRFLSPVVSSLVLFLATLVVYLHSPLRGVRNEHLSAYYDALACVPHAPSLRPTPLPRFEGDAVYTRLASLAELELDKVAGYMRHDYMDKPLRSLACVLSARANKLDPRFTELAGALHDVALERSPVPPRLALEGCASSAQYGGAWALLAGAPPTGAPPAATHAIRVAADLVDMGAVRACRAGFAAVQLIVCNPGTAGDIAALPLPAVAACLVRLAAGWSAVHPIVAFTPADGEPLAAVQPARFARAFNAYLTAYIAIVGPLAAARSIAVPVLFPLQVARGMHPRSVIDSLEPLEPNLRNVLERETGFPVALRGYRLLPSLPTWRRPARCVLVDVGTNGFLSSPKALLDAYEPWLRFDEVLLIEPHVSEVPPEYAARYPGLRIITAYTEVGTGNEEADVLHLLRTLAQEEDFVALKYDVDEGSDTPTLEWGFLYNLLASDVLRLVDELFIELHFWHPEVSWQWRYHGHSMWEAFDAMRQLRARGHAVHAWS
jgi:hypothetical protein